MSKVMKYRSNVYLFLLLAGFISFMLSFAINNIVVWALIPFYFIDNKVNIKNKLSRAFSNPVVWCFILFFLAQIIGALYSENTLQAWDRVLSMSPLVFLPAIILSEPITQQDKNKVLTILKYVVPVLFAGFLLHHVFIEQRPLISFVHFSIIDRLSVSQFYLSFLVMIPFLAALDGVLKREQIILNLIILTFSAIILVLFKNLTSLLFILIVWIFLMLRFLVFAAPGKSVGLLAGGAVLLLLSFQAPIIKSRLEFLQKTTDFDIETIATKNRFTHTKNTLEHRLFIDYIAFKEIKNSFPFGVGTGDIQEVLNRAYEEIGFKSGMRYKYNAHNQFLEEWLKTGIFGGIMFLVLLFFMFKRMTLTDPYYAFLLLFFVTACFFESYLNRQHGVFILGFIISFFNQRTL